MSDPTEDIDDPNRGDAVEFDTIRRALIEGEQSGEPKPFDFAAFKQRKTAKHG